MGLLPSQKYDFVLKSFCKYLEANYTTIGYKQGDTNEYWIKNFLRECDNGGWEI